MRFRATQVGGLWAMSYKVLVCGLQAVGCELWLLVVGFGRRGDDRGTANYEKSVNLQRRKCLDRGSGDNSGDGESRSQRFPSARSTGSEGKRGCKRVHFLSFDSLRIKSDNLPLRIFNEVVATPMAIFVGVFACRKAKQFSRVQLWFLIQGYRYTQG